MPRRRALPSASKQPLDVGDGRGGRRRRRTATPGRGAMVFFFYHAGNGAQGALVSVAVSAGLMLLQRRRARAFGTITHVRPRYSGRRRTNHPRIFENCGDGAAAAATS